MALFPLLLLFWPVTASSTHLRSEPRTLLTDLDPASPQMETSKTAVDIQKASYGEYPATSSGNSSQGFTPMGVIGRDDRKYFKPTEFPDRVFGRLASSTGSCTAALIGEWYILTAAHCFYEDGAFRGYEGVDFILGQYMTKSGRMGAIDAASVIAVWAGTNFGEPADFGRDIQKDWAIAKISKPLGSEYGFLGISTEDESVILSQREKFTLIGYSGDGFIRHAGKDANCSLLAKSGSLYVHDCDGEQGSSGGSIVRVSDNVVVALNNAEADGANFAVPTKAFADAYRKIRMEE